MNDNLQVIITRGIPASGKTTWAKEFMLESSLTWKRINRDELRLMLDSAQYSKENEDFVKEVEVNLIILSLLNNYNVIVDATNLDIERTQFILNIIESLQESGKIKKDVGVIFKDFFNVSVKECIERDQQREHSVGSEVILRFAAILKALQLEMDSYEIKQ